MADVKLNSLKFPNLPDRYILDADKVNYSDSETYADGSVGKALQNKAEVDGSYESMTVGNAEQLVSNVRVNDKTPYLFRTSGGSVDIGDREYVNGIVGGTVAWNQMIVTRTFNSTSGGLTAVSNNDGKYAVTGEASSSAINLWFWGNYNVSTALFTLKANHKYYLKHANLYVVDTGTIGSLTTVLGDEGKIVTKAEDTGICGVRCPNAVVEQTYNLNIYPQLFDLTQMFGSTIADYIYSLETANAGAGVAWFKKLFNKPYYAYNAGELKSVSGLVSHDMTGFNQWDEEWEVGSIDSTTGEFVSQSNIIRSKNYIPVVPNTTYYVYAPVQCYIFYYDANKNLITDASLSNDTFDYKANATTHTPNNAAYMRFHPNGYYHQGSDVKYYNDICINLSWDGSRNGEYEPYELHSYPLDSTLTLRGIPKLDTNNKLYYDGDMYEPDGTVTRKYGIVDLGSVDWYYYTEYQMFYLRYAIADKKAGVTNIICSKYPTSEAVWTVSNDKVCGGNGSNGTIYIRDTSLGTDPSAFKTAMSGVYLVYELDEPTEETADPYQQTEIVSDFGTEEFVISDNTFAVPVGHDTEYPIDLRAKLEMAPNSPSDGDGDYIVRQTNGVNEYVPLVIEDALPTIPSTAGTYTLTVTVADGADPVLSWEA